MDYNKVEDAVLKNAMNYFKEGAVNFFGVDTKITEPADIEIKNVDIKTNYLDYLFHTEQGDYLHFEFQTTNKKDDLKRFLYYDASLYYRDRKKVRTLVVYSADITETETIIDAGSILYKIEAFYMKNLNGDEKLSIIEDKISKNNHLSDEDILTIALSPLMNGKLTKSERTIKSIDLADSILEDKDKMKCLTLLYALFDKFGEDSSKKKFMEVISMTDIGRMLTEEAEARGIEEGIAKGKTAGKIEGKVEILTKILVKKFNIKPEEYIDKIRNLSDEVIDNIIIDIFDIERIEELEKYFK